MKVQDLKDLQLDGIKLVFQPVYSNIIEYNRELEVLSQICLKFNKE